MRRYCFALDLIDDDSRIAEYDKHHEKVWPEVEASFVRAGIIHVELYRVSNRLFMLLDTDDSFSFEKKAAIDAEDPVVQKWETLMGSYQQSIPGTEGEKWRLMKRIYKSALEGY